MVASSLYALGLLACDGPVDDDDAETTQDASAQGQSSAAIRAVIVKTAGYLPEDGPPEHPDAITRATTADYNSHVYAEQLAQLLHTRGIETEVFDHLDCLELSCARIDDGDDEGTTASIVVVAAKTEYLQVLPEGQALIPHIAGLRPMPEVVAAVTSYGSADTALQPYEEKLAGSGLAVVTGAALGPAGGMDDDRMEASLADLADRLSEASGVSPSSAVR